MPVKNNVLAAADKCEDWQTLFCLPEEWYLCSRVCRQVQCTGSPGEPRAEGTRKFERTAQQAGNRRHREGATAALDCMCAWLAGWWGHKYLTASQHGASGPQPRLCDTYYCTLMQIWIPGLLGNSSTRHH